MEIWKFPIIIADRQVVLMPKDSEILTVQMQYDSPNVWAAVNPAETTESRVLLLRGTGHTLGDAEGAPYIGTFQMLGGELIWHLFDGGTE